MERMCCFICIILNTLLHMPCYIFCQQVIHILKDNKRRTPGFPLNLNSEVINILVSTKLCTQKMFEFKEMNKIADNSGKERWYYRYGS